MGKHIGVALRRSVTRRHGGTEVAPDRKVQITLLMNPTRRKILQYLCTYPVSPLALIQRDLKMADSSSKWHLASLTKGGFIETHKVGKSRVYAPLGMIDEQYLPILSILNTESYSALYNSIRKKPGISQKEICQELEVTPQAVNRFTGVMLELDLLAMMKDGRFIRYFPTDLLRTARSRNRLKVDNFVEQITEKLALDGLNPKVIRNDRREIWFRITTSKHRNELRLNTDPFVTVLARPRPYYRVRPGFLTEEESIVEG